MFDDFFFGDFELLFLSIFMDFFVLGIIGDFSLFKVFKFKFKFILLFIIGVWFGFEDESFNFLFVKLLESERLSYEELEFRFDFGRGVGFLGIYRVRDFVGGIWLLCDILMFWISVRIFFVFNVLLIRLIMVRVDWIFFRVIGGIFVFLKRVC